MTTNKNSQSSSHTTQQSGQSNQGFAAMDPQKQRDIASQGGKAAHREGTAHEWTSEEAKEAGKKGGSHSHSTQDQKTG